MKKVMHYCRDCLVPVGEFDLPPDEVVETIRRMGGMVRPRVWCANCAKRHGIKLPEEAPKS